MDFLERFDNLPEEVQEIFGSNKPRIAIERACFLYDVNEENIKKITLPVRDIFLKDINLSQLPIIIESELHVRNQFAHGIAFEICRNIFVPISSYFSDAVDLAEKWRKEKAAPIIAEERAWKRVLDIEPWITKEEKEKKQEEIKNQTELAKNESLSLSVAMEKYPKIGEQGITDNQLKMQYFPMPARPSIKNWITDYHDSMGGGKHSPIDRGNYLFHSENGKKLTSPERQRISLVLKSLDDESLLTIDPVAEVIVFGGVQEPQQEVQPAAQDINQKSSTPLGYIRQDYVSNPPQREDDSMKIGSDSFMPDDKKDAGFPDVFEKFAPRKLERPMIKAEPSSAGNVSFSSSQRLPIEQTQEVQSRLQPAIPRPVEQRVEALSQTRPTFQSSIERRGEPVGISQSAMQQNLVQKFGIPPRPQPTMQRPVERRVEVQPQPQILTQNNPQPSQQVRPQILSQPQQQPQYQTQMQQSQPHPQPRPTAQPQAERKINVSQSPIVTPNSAPSVASQTPQPAIPREVLVAPTPVRPAYHPVSRNPYHIGPARHVANDNFSDGKNNDPKIEGNTVYLN